MESAAAAEFGVGPGLKSDSVKISFLPFNESHLPMLRYWLNKGHIKPHWQEPEDDDALKEKFLNSMPARSVHSFVFTEDVVGTGKTSAQPLGYIQYYEACKVGGGWWPDELPGVFGIDLMIGEATRLGQGLSTIIIQEFIRFIQSRERVTEFIIDPDAGNQRAIRAFEKVGFVRERELATPNGNALLMRLKT